MKAFPILGMVGGAAILASAEAAADAGRIPLDQALESISAADLNRMAVEAMPEAVRDAFLGANRQLRQARATVLDGRVAAIADLPERGLSVSDTTIARGLFLRMAQPLTADEKRICQLLSLSEAQYVERRNDELGAALPGVHSAHGLSEDELTICQALGLEPAAYAAAKASA